MTDSRIEQIIARLLQAGVMLSAAIVLAGGIWYLIDCGGIHAHYEQFVPPPETLRSPMGLIASLAHPDPPAIIQFGLLVLIATPVARVLFSLLAFAAEHDRMYVVMTLIVLAVLTYSLAVPH
jgi:uncharacterized membrane protein